MAVCMRTAGSLLDMQTSVCMPRMVRERVRSRSHQYQGCPRFQEKAVAKLKEVLCSVNEATEEHDSLANFWTIWFR
jgi:hypothetical protein